MSQPSFIKISFIVTTYNIANYVEKCIRSLCDQSLKELEIIVVDDVSDDGTFEQLKALSAADTRLTVLSNKAHSGHPSEGRNTGIEKAKGQYVCFIDGDDFWATPSAAQIMYDIMEQEGSDIGIPSWNVYDEKQGRLIEGKARPYKNVKTGGLSFHFSEVNTLFWTFFCAAAGSKIYRRDFLIRENLRYENLLNEDYYFSLHSYFLAKKITNIEEALYTVTIHRKHNEKNRSVRKRDDKTWLSHIEKEYEVFPQIYASLEQHNLVKEGKEIFLLKLYECVASRKTYFVPYEAFPKYVAFIRNFLRKIVDENTKFTYLNYVERMDIRDLILLTPKGYISNLRETYLDSHKRLHRYHYKHPFLRLMLEIWLCRIEHHKVMGYSRLRRYFYYFRASWGYLFKKEENPD